MKQIFLVFVLVASALIAVLAILWCVASPHSPHEGAAEEIPESHHGGDNISAPLNIKESDLHAVASPPLEGEAAPGDQIASEIDEISGDPIRFLEESIINLTSGEDLKVKKITYIEPQSIDFSRDEERVGASHSFSGLLRTTLPGSPQPDASTPISEKHVLVEKRENTGELVYERTVSTGVAGQVAGPQEGNASVITRFLLRPDGGTKVEPIIVDSGGTQITFVEFGSGTFRFPDEPIVPGSSYSFSEPLDGEASASTGVDLIETSVSFGDYFDVDGRTAVAALFEGSKIVATFSAPGEEGLVTFTHYDIRSEELVEVDTGRVLLAESHATIVNASEESTIGTQVVARQVIRD